MSRETILALIHSRTTSTIGTCISTTAHTPSLRIIAHSSHNIFLENFLPHGSALMSCSLQRHCFCLTGLSSSSFMYRLVISSAANCLQNGRIELMASDPPSSLCHRKAFPSVTASKKFDKANVLLPKPF